MFFHASMPFEFTDELDLVRPPDGRRFQDDAPFIFCQELRDYSKASVF